MKDHTQETVTMMGKCIGCKKVEVLSAQQILNAEQSGAAMSTCCFMPMTIKSISIKPIRKKKKSHDQDNIVIKPKNTQQCKT